jgi:hypothetical protein
MKKYVKSLEIRKADIKAREKQWKNNIWTIQKYVKNNSVLELVTCELPTRKTLYAIVHYCIQ